MIEYINTVEAEFAASGNKIIAAQQKAYMRNQFDFFGLKTPVRREIQQPFLIKQYLPPKAEIEKLVKIFWERPERDFQLFGQELVYKYAKKLTEKDITLLEYMAANKSWWDTVDFIAVKLMGQYFKLYPKQKDKYIQKWLDTNNIWLQRCALLFQLKYKEKIDIDCLKLVINSLLGSNEFFINKAIGWVLREYSRTNPEWVINFCEQTNLQPLSRKEALRLIE